MNEPDQLGIDGQRRAEPGFPDPDLQLGKPAIERVLQEHAEGEFEMNN
jgi:hypothetical protein